MNASEVATKVLKLYDNNPNRWTQFVVARTIENIPCPVGFESATRWCLSGAVQEVTYTDSIYDSTYNSIDATLEELMCAIDKVKHPDAREDYTSVSDFNDEVDRTFEEVIAVLKLVAERKAR